ncbi:ras GTPase [Naegleria gruberi]|uniref:Ras GTPase n=1 Tax=Naegleria gruberi TaxID=5762 RepID=D2V0E9_NAEGR|nr:ras GTPase [Naegleria gruberi]EFC49513.1 ras GTPase [Naegleria gruberi]|eukprot:XP_002682257.1 ras GTPase [Naegleria gruberi]
MILGDGESGKTSIAKQQIETSGFTFKQPKSDQEVLEGQNCFVIVDGKDVTVKLLDSPPGNDIGLTIECVKDCDGFILVVDLSRPKTLQVLNRYKALMLENLSMSTIPCVIAANKCDLERQLSMSQVNAFAKNFFIDRSIASFECSALSGSGINDMFSFLYNLIKTSQKEDKPIIKAKQKRGLLSSSSESNADEWF